mmetsp:Transcript_12942/g.45495  ORF Transcript_12942/g.45495 Transcript_12942/m.45495 type:complete len:342 (+) Transcript_12942:3123-4148(+)
MPRLVILEVPHEPVVEDLCLAGSGVEVEAIDNEADKQVHGEESSEDEVDDKEQGVHHRVILLRAQILSCDVDHIGQDPNVLDGVDAKESEESISERVKVMIRPNPRTRVEDPRRKVSRQSAAVGLATRKRGEVGIGTSIELPSEERHANNGEDDEGNHHEDDDVPDGSKSPDQRVDQNPHPDVSLHQPQRPQGAAETKHLGNLSVGHDVGDVDPGEQENDAVHDVPAGLQVCVLSEEKPVAHDAADELNGEDEGEEVVQLLRHDWVQQGSVARDIVIWRRSDEEDASHDYGGEDHKIECGLLDQPRAESSSWMEGMEVEQNSLHVLLAACLVELFFFCLEH